MKITPNDEPLRFDGDNSYPDCTCCGQCCGLNVLAITPEELDAMHECIERKHVHPIDRKGERCPLQSPEGGCRYVACSTAMFRALKSSSRTLRSSFPRTFPCLI